jgi:hypothetical protein
MPVNQSQVRTDVAAVEAALNTLAAHFAGDAYYWAHPRQLIEQARGAMKSMREHFSGATGAQHDPTK